MENVLKILLEKFNSGALLAVITIVSIIYILFLYYYKIFKLRKRSDLEELRIKQDIIEQVNKEEKNDQQIVDKIINLNISNHLIKNDLNIEDKFIHKLLNLHHEQALQQSNIQFWFSIVASIVGFIFIILIILISESNEWYDYIFKIFPGTIIEVVSVLFINQARETRDKATKFFTELNFQIQIEKSVEIADTIENEEIRSDVKSKIALHIIGFDKNLDTK